MLPVRLRGQRGKNSRTQLSKHLTSSKQNHRPIATRSILFLSQRFPPHTGAAARRLGMLADKWRVEAGVFVIRRGGAGEPDGEADGVITLSVTDVRSVSNTGTALSTRQKTGFLRHLLPLRQAFPFVYLTDDGGPAYRQKAFQRACELIETHGITTVFSSFRPWSDHLVARRLKQQYPQLHWIADFRDLPVDAVRRDIWWPALQVWWGRRVVRPADEMWCVSEGQRAQFRGWHSNIRVVRNALRELPSGEPSPVTERFTIAYTGSLYGGLQTVEPLAVALNNLLADGTVSPHHLCFAYCGKDHDLFRQWTASLPPECLDVQPTMAPAAAQKKQRSATVLLLLTWSAPGYYGVLTAKLWDYLAAGRPILALVNGPGDQELQKIIAGADAGAVFPTKEQGGIEAQLRTWIGEWATTGTVACSPNRAFLSDFLV